MAEQKIIFFVDDSITNLTVGRDALSDTYDIFTFNSGLSMLKMLEKKVKIPNLILLDIEMPEMNGYEVLKILKGKEDTMHIPVIFLTAKDDFDSESKGLELGAIDYIKKPFSQPLLLERLEKYFIETIGR